MADAKFSGGLTGISEKAKDLGDGTYARVVATISVNPDGTMPVNPPLGRAAAASSDPVVLSSEDFAALRQTYRRSASVGTTAGDALLVTGVTTAGSVTVTLAGGGTISINVPLGSSIWPFAATGAVLGTAVGGSFSSLFFS